MVRIALVDHTFDTHRITPPRHEQLRHLDQAVSVMAFTVRGGRIVEINALTDPERLRRLPLPLGEATGEGGLSAATLVSQPMSLPHFVREYATVRRAEGWGSADPAYYLALPYRDLTGRYSKIWRIRARSYTTFLTHVLKPLELGRLRILDLGAGNAWLSHRLARRGHAVIAIDVLDDPLDGLRAVRHYTQRSRPQAVLAEFDRLPLPDKHADVVIFNASLHYSTDYQRTLAESLRVLRQGGTLIILDSPMYSDPTSGQRMVQEREARFLATYGFASNALDCEHFLTPSRLDGLSAALHLRWQFYAARLDPLTTLRRQLNGLRARREPARFPVIVGTRA